MKTIAPSLLCALAAAALTAGALELLHARRKAGDGTAPASREAVHVSGPETPAEAGSVPPAALIDATLRGDLDELSMRLTALEGRLASLERRPAVIAEPLDPPADDVAALDADPQARDFILSVVTEKQEAEEAEQRARMQAILEDRLRERVARLSTELGLSPRDEDAVYDVLLSENTRRTELFDSMRREGFVPGSREVIRDELDALRDWKRDELTRQLGPDLAAQVLEREPNPWGRDRREDGERRRREEADSGG